MQLMCHVESVPVFQGSQRLVKKKVRLLKKTVNIENSFCSLFLRRYIFSYIQKFFPFQHGLVFVTSFLFV